MEEELLDIKSLTSDAIVREETKIEEAEIREKEAKKNKIPSSLITALAKEEAKKQEEARKELLKIEKEIEEVKKREVINKIELYLSRFPFLRTLGFKYTKSSSLLELEEILKIIRETMDKQRSIQQLHKYTFYGLSVLESTWGNGSQMTFLPEKLRMDLSHMTEFYASGLFMEDIEPLLMEIDIEYPWIGRRSLNMRILEALTGILYKVDSINKNPEVLEKIRELRKKTPVEVKLPGEENED